MKGHWQSNQWIYKERESWLLAIIQLTAKYYIPKSCIYTGYNIQYKTCSCTNPLRHFVILQSSLKQADSICYWNFNRADIWVLLKLFMCVRNLQVTFLGTLTNSTFLEQIWTEICAVIRLKSNIRRSFLPIGGSWLNISRWLEMSKD